MKINRGDIFLTQLSPKDKGVTRTRPVLVISNDISNQHSGTVTVLPITARKLSALYPFEVDLPPGTGSFSKASKIKTDQIRTLERSKIIKFLGKLDEEIMTAVESALKVHLSLG